MPWVTLWAKGSFQAGVRHKADDLDRAVVQRPPTPKPVPIDEGQKLENAPGDRSRDHEHRSESTWGKTMSGSSSNR